MRPLFNTDEQGGKQFLFLYFFIQIATILHLFFLFKIVQFTVIIVEYVLYVLIDSHRDRDRDSLRPI